MDADKLTIALGGLELALYTTDIAGILEPRRIPRLPYGSGLATGVIGMRGAPIVVIDLRRAFNLPPLGRDLAAYRRVVVVKTRGQQIGLDIGTAGLGFIWAEEALNGNTAEDKSAFTSSILEMNGRRVRVIDCAALFDETARILSTELTSDQ
ncbi:MAG: chemotaxis protein CheW [Deltaproteobacteria bacterium]|nr:chemotaxis protein CheW [Deltaproteobacteria bacterium]